MAMMEIASNLKASARFFQVFDFVSQIKSVKNQVKTDLVSFPFKICLILFPWTSETN